MNNRITLAISKPLSDQVIWMIRMCQELEIFFYISHTEKILSGENHLFSATGQIRRLLLALLKDLFIKLEIIAKIDNTKTQLLDAGLHSKRIAGITGCPNLLIGWRSTKKAGSLLTLLSLPNEYIV